MRVLLVNSNEIRPPIAPLGLDYLADALAAAGHEVAVADVCLDPRGLEDAVGSFEPGAVAVTLRNTDDCYLGGQAFFLPGVKRLIERLRARIEAPVVLGGVGFSVLPEAALAFLGAEYGVAGEGEFAFPELLRRLETGESPAGLPGLLWREGGALLRAPPEPGDLGRLPSPTRSWFDLRRYFREGGQVGFETKRGCDRACVYCADPVAKGRRVRLHAPERIVAEVSRLLSLGVDHLHTCDSEFNLPEAHARAVCRALADAGLGGRVRWYAYCAPRPFSRELAGLMARAGCAGVDFGADHSDPGVLESLGREHRAEDLERAADACRFAGLPFMFDLLLGSPAETPETLRAAIEFAKRSDPTRVGLSLGIRLYPGTRLTEELGAAGRDLLAPTFYVAPAVADDLFARVGELVEGDPRFLFADPSRRERNYNYNENRVLEDAIAAGARGAYWDILRRVAERGLLPAEPGLAST